ncbi:MAG TPA: coproporphyrinogen III oxidase, partial [Fibrobacteria bacterium]|nr:coproporphyrinogen III oxidase [Fibrobacteria bacterium]
YIQNVKESSAYGREVVAGRLPVDRAYILTREERFDREAINSVMCRGELDLSRIGDTEGFSAQEAETRLRPGLDRLEPLIADGLCTFDGRILRTTSQGRFAVRNIAFLFDPLLGVGEGRYSRTV